MMPSKTGVLLADDDAALLESLRSLLEAEGDLEVVGRARDGVEAIHMAARARPQVAILDITMSGMDGIQATRRILEASPLTRVLILTAHSARSYLESALHAGARGYVLKEAAGHELIAALRAILAGGRYISAALKE